mmetsp:Transcript_49286/g.113920  ORF Transcript_49286/g.113920 Transcript_49286/m.113920 type:complete len:210 (+) Transcript_49286:144-773(+)
MMRSPTSGTGHGTRLGRTSSSLWRPCRLDRLSQTWVVVTASSLLLSERTATLALAAISAVSLCASLVRRWTSRHKSPMSWPCRTGVARLMLLSASLCCIMWPPCQEGGSSSRKPSASFAQLGELFSTPGRWSRAMGALGTSSMRRTSSYHGIKKRRSSCGKIQARPRMRTRRTDRTCLRRLHLFTRDTATCIVRVNLLIWCPPFLVQSC